MKTVATTLTSILNNPIMDTILDRSKDINPIIDEVLGLWSFDLYKRKPGPAYIEDDVFVGTDLDLATFLIALAERGAVINLPTYQGFRPTTITEGVRVVSPKNRHGKVLSLTSNQDLFTFCVKIIDMNVIESEKVGGFRNFTITDPNGDWYDGWKTIEFDPSAKENQFLTEHKVWSDSSVFFKHFVHPNRWVSFYGKSYFMTKALIERLSEEARNYRVQYEEMLRNGVIPTKAPGASQDWPESETEEGEAKVFNAFQVEVDLPENTTEFKKWAPTTENLDYLIERRRKLVYTIIPKLRFISRLTELAFFKHGDNKFPAWIQGAKWEENYVPKGKRTKWNRLVLFQPKVGERGVALRTRTFEKKEIVSKEYAAKC